MVVHLLLLKGDLETLYMDLFRTRRLSNGEINCFNFLAFCKRESLVGPICFAASSTGSSRQAAFNACGCGRHLHFCRDRTFSNFPHSNLPLRPHA